MKATHSARRVLRIRVVLLGVTLVVMVAVELGLGESLVERFGQATALYTDEVQAPNLSLGDVLAALH